MYAHIYKNAREDTLTHAPPTAMDTNTHKHRYALTLQNHISRCM